jgi:hypothetical protein
VVGYPGIDLYFRRLFETLLQSTALQPECSKPMVGMDVGTLGSRRNHSMDAGSSGNGPTIEKPIAKTSTLRTITANMTGARFSAPGTPYCIGASLARRQQDREVWRH